MKQKYKYDGALIKILNWEKYNPRSDSKKPSWFRVDNDFLSDFRIFELKTNQKLYWIALLSQISCANNSKFYVSFKFLKSLTGMSEAKQSQAIEIFEKLGLIICEARKDSHATNVTNVTNERYAQEKKEEKPVSVSESFKTLKACYEKLCAELWPENKPPNIDQQLEWLLRKTADVKIGVIVLNAVARKAQNPTDQWPIRKIFMFSTFKADSWNLIWDYAREYYADRITEEQIQKVMSR